MLIDISTGYSGCRLEAFLFCLLYTLLYICAIRAIVFLPFTALLLHKMLCECWATPPESDREKLPVPRGRDDPKLLSGDASDINTGMEAIRIAFDFLLSEKHFAA